MKNNRTVLQNLNIINTIRKFDKWGAWCDYLRLCYKNESDFIEESIDLVDTDNSNFFTREVWGQCFTIQKWFCTLGVSLTFFISYNDIVVPVAQFVKYNENASFLFNCYWKFDFYGSFFRLVDMWYLEKSLFLLLKVLISEENPKITRYDYRLDFFSMKNIKVPEIKEFVKYVHTQSKTDEHREGMELTNWIVGSKNNWRYAIRYYDKLLDTDKKEKVFLYQDYFMYNTVHRLEFEFQPNFLKWYTFYDFYDWVIEQRINIILGLSEKMFWGPLFYQYVEDYRIKEKDKSRYLKRYSSSSIRLAKNGINPLIQCYKSLFYELEESELHKNMSEFLDFVWQDKFQYTLRYNKMKELFTSLHKI